MRFTYNDGGRANAGFKGKAGDCVCRAVAIATEQDYATVYVALARGAGSERLTKGKTARNDIHTSRRWFKDYMIGLGWVWTATMGIGTGCKVHLTEGELPVGCLIVAVSRHMVAVVDGTILDTFNPDREGRRCVYGYWRKAVS